MRAITLWRPWPNLFVLKRDDGRPIKWIETRSHSAFRCLKGQRVALHAGKRFDEDASEVVYDAFWSGDDTALPRSLGPTLREAQDRLNNPRAWPEGIICTAFVKDARWLTSDDQEGALYDCKGRFGLIVEDICPIDPPQPCRGAQGIWEWDPAASLRPQPRAASLFLTSAASLFGNLPGVPGSHERRTS